MPDCIYTDGRQKIARTGCIFLCCNRMFSKTLAEVILRVTEFVSEAGTVNWDSSQQYRDIWCQYKYIVVGIVYTVTVRIIIYAWFCFRGGLLANS